MDAAYGSGGKRSRGATSASEDSPGADVGEEAQADAGADALAAKRQRTEVRCAGQRRLSAVLTLLTCPLDCRATC